jgi:hypothetical protein
MEGVAPAASLLRPRSSARSLILLAADSSAARRSSAARGNPDSRELCVIWLTATICSLTMCLFFVAFGKGGAWDRGVVWRRLRLEQVWGVGDDA